MSEPSRLPRQQALLALLAAVAMVTACSNLGGADPSRPTRVGPSFGGAAEDAQESVHMPGLPTAGAVGPSGSVLLVYAAPGPAGAGVQLYDPSGDLTSEGLFGRFVEPDTVSVHAHDEGFFLVDTYASRAWSMTLDGRLSRLPMDDRPTRPRAGDIPFIGLAVWAYRPSTGMVHSNLVGPAGTRAVHVDGHGVLWTLGRPADGMAVVYSAAPGDPWVRQVVGEFSDTHRGCVCDTYPGPLGRGAVIVVAGLPLSHVSLDYGRTWKTWDISGTTPMRRIRARGNYPAISALADGRLFVGDVAESWVAEDADNDSFVRLGREVTRAKRQSGLTDDLLFRPGEVSPDAGMTWVSYQ